MELWLGRYRGGYMIYPPAYNTLPWVAKVADYERRWKILAGNREFVVRTT